MRATKRPPTPTRAPRACSPRRWRSRAAARAAGRRPTCARRPAGRCATRPPRRRMRTARTRRSSGSSSIATSAVISFVAEAIARCSVRIAAIQHVAVAGIDDRRGRRGDPRRPLARPARRDGEREERHDRRRARDPRPRRALRTVTRCRPASRVPLGAGGARGACDSRSLTRCPVTSACGSSVGLSNLSSSSVTPVLSAIRPGCRRRARCRNGGCCCRARSSAVPGAAARCVEPRSRSDAAAGRSVVEVSPSPPRDAITTTRKAIAKTASAAGASSLMGFAGGRSCPVAMIPARRPSSAARPP